MKPSPADPLENVLHYANVWPTEGTWRRIVLGPTPTMRPLPDRPVYGVDSLSEINRILAQYRDFLAAWVNLESPYSEEAHRLVTVLNERAKPVFKAWGLSPEDEKLFERWETGGDTFEELIYYYLALALKDVSYRDIHRCEECEKFFHEPAKRQWKFCSARCRNRALVRRHREKAPGKKPAAKKQTTARRKRKT